MDIRWGEDTGLIVALGVLFWVSRNVPVFAFARTRGVPHAWLALVPMAEYAMLLICIGASRVVVVLLTAVLAVLPILLIALAFWLSGTDEITGWRVRGTTWVTPDVVLIAIWMAACRDAHISRGWALLAAWPLIGGLGGWRIVRAASHRISAPPPGLAATTT